VHRRVEESDLGSVRGRGRCCRGCRAFLGHPVTIPTGWYGCQPGPFTPSIPSPRRSG
jgi:hypothetical protein